MRIDKTQRNNLIIGGLFISSFLIQLFLHDFRIAQSFFSAIFQVISSWILAFVFVQFRRKYYKTNLFPYWRNFYVIIIIMSIMASFVYDF